MNKREVIGIIFLFLMLVGVILAGIAIFSSQTYAHPILPTEFYGTIRYYNGNATGAITAYVGFNICGSFTVSNAGYYGVLSCMGVDTDNPNSTGGIDGNTISFRFNSNPTTATGDVTFTEGAFKYVNITYPPVFCGDDFCDALEDCITCPEDCNECNYTGNATNETGNVTPPSGGGSGGGGGGGGGYRGGGISGGELPYGEYFCTESWVCGEWSNCSILGLRNRTCRDLNNCGTYRGKPIEVEECEYIGTCFDNIVNCHDGKCEEGIDCEGPCEKRCPLIEQPFFNITTLIPKLPKKVCERHINYNDPALWLFLIIIIISIIVRDIYTYNYVYRLRKNEKITPLERAKKTKSAKRKAVIFTITIIALAFISLLYSYYFLMCPSDFFKFSWMLILALILVPFVIHAILKKYEYSESVHVSKARQLDDVHYQSIVKMIEIENKILAEEENAIATRLYDLSRRDEFREFMEKDENIKNLYRNLVRLYTEYRDKKNPFNVEKAVCDEINALEADIPFKTEIAKHREMKNIYERLKRLYLQYEEKQRLYEQLDEIEQSDIGKEDNKKENIHKENKHKK